MSPFVVSLLFALGLGGWVYNVVMKRNGSQTQQALMVAGFVGVIGMIVFFTLFSTIFRG